MVRNVPRPLLICLSLAAAAAMSATCAKSEKSENPLSPYIAGPMPGVEITLPVLLEPGQGWRLKSNEQPITLLVENAASNSPRPRLYRFEVAADGGFRTIVFSREGIAEGAGGQSGRTALRLPDRLQDGRVYFWRARAYDGANTGSFAVGLNFEIQLPSRIFEPQPIEPQSGQTTASNPPHLKIRNSQKQGPVNPVNYLFQLSANNAFTDIAAQGSVPENGGGETVYLPAAVLQAQATYYWRVLGSDGQVHSEWATSSFRTAASSPGPSGPLPPPPPGGNCSGAPLDVVTCRRAQYGSRVSPSEATSLLRSIASDLNRGLASPYYGILPKSGGNQCGGYACDVICATSSDHWDVFTDGPDSTQNYSGTAAPTWRYVGPGVPCTPIP
jgi:hypothetical protein